MPEPSATAALAVAARVVLGGVFAYSAVRKRSAAGSAAALAAFGLPAPRLAAATLAGAEVAVAAWLLGGLRSPWPAGAALALLAMFNLVVGVNLARGRRLPCPCFGSGSRPIGTGTLVRNGWLLALAVVGTGPGGGADAAAVAGLAVVLGAVTVALIRRTG